MDKSISPASCQSRTFAIWLLTTSTLSLQFFNLEENVRVGSSVRFYGGYKRDLRLFRNSIKLLK